MKNAWGWALGLSVLLAGCGQPKSFSTITLPGPIVWGDIQTASDAPTADWNWLASDLALKDVSTTVAPIWPYALWDQASCHGDWPSAASLLGNQFQAPYPPCDTAAYTTWLHAVVQRYPQVLAWQVLTEVEQQTAPFARYQGTPTEYVQLVATTTQAMRQIQPNTLMLSATIPPFDAEAINFWGPVLQDPTFNQAIDGIVLAADTEAELTAAKSVLERYQITKPIWVVHNDQTIWKL